MRSSSPQFIFSTYHPVVVRVIKHSVWTSLLSTMPGAGEFFWCNSGLLGPGISRRQCTAEFSSSVVLTSRDVRRIMPRDASMWRLTTERVPSESQGEGKGRGRGRGEDETRWWGES